MLEALENLQKINVNEARLKLIKDGSNIDPNSLQRMKQAFGFDKTVENILNPVQNLKEYIFHDNQQSDYLIFLKPGTKSIIFQNFLAGEMKFYIELESKVDNSSVFTNLPNNYLFYYANFGNYAFVIDLVTRKCIKSKTKEVKESVGCPTYHRGSIFVFGGQNSKSCEKFDLIDNSWQKIEPLPLPLLFSVTAVIEENILVTGNNSLEVYIYKIEMNAYFQLPDKFSPGHKILLSYGNTVYFLYNDSYNSPYNSSWNLSNASFYKSKKNELINGFFSVVKTNIKLNYLRTSPVYHQDSFYLLFFDNMLYKFNPTTYKSVLVKSML